MTTALRGDSEPKIGLTPRGTLQNSGLGTRREEKLEDQPSFSIAWAIENGVLES